MKNSTEKIINDLIERYPVLDVCYDDVIRSCELLLACFKNNKLLICGNGGSASDSLHIVGELMKSFTKKRDLSHELKQKIKDEFLIEGLEMGLPVISLVSEISLITAFSNDKNPDLVFAQQVINYGKQGDILLCISTSGNSKNCVYAAKVAKALDMIVISLTGKNDSLLKKISDSTIMVPELETYKIQELHLPVYHALCLAVENELFE